MTKNINKILLTTALAFGSLSVAMAGGDTSVDKSGSVGNFYGKVEVGVAVNTRLSSQSFEFSRSNTDTGFVFGVEGGYKLDNNLRVGLNFGHQENKVSSHTQVATGTVPELNFKMGKLKLNTAMFNVYYDIESSGKFTPYIMAGLGATRNKVSKSTVKYDVSVRSLSNIGQESGDGGFKLVDRSTQGQSTLDYKGKSKSNLAWNAGFGGLYKIDTNLHLDVSYKYKDLGKISTSVTGDLGEENVRALKLKEGYTAKLRSHNVMLGVVYSF